MKKKLIIFGAALLTTYCVIGLARADEVFQCHYQTVTTDPDLGLSQTEQVCVNEGYICEIFGGKMSCQVKRD